MAVVIKSYNEILGDMIRKIIADTPLNDINTGSVLLTLMEACAANDFENNTAILNVLELLNIDAIRNNDLDNRAGDFGLERLTAIKASGKIDISDSSIEVKKTILYPVKPAPIVGDTVVYVADASDWDNTGGKLYLGRNTQNFEGPLTYTSIDDFGSFYAINLASALEKDHLISEEVIDAQGTVDRIVQAGTIVKTPANNVSPEVQYAVLRDAVIPAGENIIQDVPVLAVRPGSNGNAGIDTITLFNTLPFPNAKVSNTNAFTNGRDVEADEDLRNRIKSYADSLARGTRNAILSVIIGISNEEEAKQVESAVITEPIENGKPSIIYIDDGSGFQPSQEGQSVDILLKEANGTEELMQLANFPLPRAQVINTKNAPYVLSDGIQFRILVDGLEETIQFNSEDFDNIANASVSEVVVAINNKAETFSARLDQNSTRILIYPEAYEAETIQVVGGTDFNNANTYLGFPTNERSFLALYQNNQRLRVREKAATLLTQPYVSWSIVATGNIVISVDGTPAQDRTFDTNDFGGKTFNSLTLEDWATAFNEKFAGITATASTNGRLILVSNREGDESELKILGGSYFSKMFNDVDTEAEGQDSDIDINRQNGNLRVKTDIEQGDKITAGSPDTKGSVTSKAALDGTFNVSSDAVGRPTEVVIVADAERVKVRSVILPVQAILKLEDMGSSTMRLTAPTSTAFREIQPDDYIYIANRGDTGGDGNGLWFDIASCGLYKVTRKGKHTDEGVDTWIEVLNDSIVVGTPVDTGLAGEYLIKDSSDVQAFYSDAYPQIWKGSEVDNPPAEPISGIVTNINSTLSNVKASIFRTNQVKITSSTEEGGSIALPVISGNGTLMFESTFDTQFGEFSHIANLRPGKDFLTYFKRTPPVNTNVFLGRYNYTDVKGSLDNNVVPGTPGVDAYSEELKSTGILNNLNVDYDNYIHILNGSNEEILRPIKQILPGSTVGTRHSQPRTLMDYVAGERFHISHAYEFSDLDNLVAIVDDDAIAKTVDIRFARLGKINSGSNAGIFVPTADAFSADDADNEPGIDFSNVQVWGKTLNSTEFADYAVWFRARNWYVSGGVGSGGAGILVRNNEYGPVGENFRFQLEYPEFHERDAFVSFVNEPLHTTVTYYFGSGPLKPVNADSGDIITITNPSPNVFRYTFPLSWDLSGIVIGDIATFGRDTDISEENQGTYRILDVNDAGKWIEVYNPGGQVPTAGTYQEYEAVFPDDIPGVKAVHELTVGEDASAIDQKYFVLFTPTGSAIGFWYNSTGAPAVPPSIPGVSIYSEIVVDALDDINTVATTTAAAIQLDGNFQTAAAVGAVITATNSAVGTVSIPNVDPSLTLGVNQVDSGSAGASYDGKYFTVNDDLGAVTYWFDLDNSGTPEPVHGGLRSTKISTVNTGDSGSVIATKIAAEITLDSKFSASALAAIVTIVDTASTPGPRPAPSIGTMPAGFNIAISVTGIEDVVEVVGIPTSIRFYSLLENAADDVTNKLNESDLLNCVTLTMGDFEYATRDEVYVPAGISDWSASLSYGHDPDPLSGINEYITFYDSSTYVLSFANANPNFSLKVPLTLHGVAPTIYQLDIAPNPGTAEVGEYFKLIPRTLANTYHHLTQKALSQLPIIADVEITSDNRRIQIKSKLLGSAGAVEAVGGRANAQSYSLIGDSQLNVLDGQDFLEVKIPAFPITMSKGQHVILENDAGVERLSRLNEFDTIDVVKIDDETYEYRYNQKQCDFNQYVKFTISDVSGLYGRAGTESIWRWQHTDAGSVISLTDNTLGTPASAAIHLQSDGLSASAGLKLVIVEGGTVTDAQALELTVNGPLIQGDHWVMETAAGVTYAIWINIDGNNTAPTGAQFTAAINKIRVDIDSSDTDNVIMAKVAQALLTFTNLTTNWSLSQTIGANLQGVVPGDLLVAKGDLTGWKDTNKVQATGDTEISGWPIIAVDFDNKYVDVINPIGKEMLAETLVGTNSSVEIMPSPSIRWNLSHYARPNIVQILVVGGIASVTLDAPHQMNVGDQFELQYNAAYTNTPGLVGSSWLGTVTTITSGKEFQYVVDAGVTDGVYTGGLIKDVIKTETKYAVEYLGYNNMWRLKYVSGEEPRFFTNGVAIDDLLVISGETFVSNNTGQFRVLGVEDDGIIFENENGKTQKHTVNSFNDEAKVVSFTASSNAVVGDAGAFANVEIGDWVKKREDEDTLYRQVIGSDTGNFSTATEITLGGIYQGATSDAEGVTFDQENDVNTGLVLKNIDDIIVLEGDSVLARDSVFISETAGSSWFNVNNTGTFEIQQIGSNVDDVRPFLRVNNTTGFAESGRAIATVNSKFSISENDDHRFRSIKKVEHITLDEFNQDRRVAYLTPADRIYKFSQTNKTKLSVLGKLGYSNEIANGVDGYSYYTGLLRQVQRVIDGYEPDAETYPGRKAVGGVIEILPPLIQRVTVALDVTTKEGVNLTEITNEIKSTIIQHVSSLGVGDDVILSDITVRVKNIEGVEAVTFIIPEPSNERIKIADNEKAFIEPKDISIA